MSYPVVLIPKLLDSFFTNNPTVTSFNEKQLAKKPAERLTSKKAVGSFEITDASFPLLCTRNNHFPSANSPFYWFLQPFVLLGCSIFLVVANTVGVLPQATLLLIALVSYTLIAKRRSKPSPQNEVYKSQRAEPPIFEPEKYQQQLQFERLLALRELLDDAVRKPKGTSDAPMGASEREFSHVLEQYFPGRVEAQLNFPVSINGKEYAYSTDFAIIFEEIGLSVDCEIDEPYDYKSRQPTHCVDLPYDRMRDRYFLSGNWLVIRFAEEQVVRYPKSCVKTIALVLHHITGIYSYFKSLRETPTLQKIPRWTKKQARQMARKKYRDRYLKFEKFSL